MIIPSIDLMNGKAVQLKQGMEKVLERDNPLELARYFNQFGEIAVVDLDAALGNGSNRDLIAELCRIADCRVGGGIRDVEGARELISLGAKKIIIGSRAFENDEVNEAFLQELVATVDRQKIIIAVDAYEGEIVTEGWKHRTGLALLDVAEKLENYAAELLFTCVEKEGALQGTDLETVKKLKKKTNNMLTLAGGISTMAEIRELTGLGVHAQLGMAIYTGRIFPEEAFIESLNWKSDLIPTVVIDTEGQVLMVAYSNKKSLQRTFNSGKMWYYSRSRQKLWMKGETSGNVQDFIQFRVDCDSDTLLAKVDQKGVACHLGNYSCFGDKKFTLEELYRVVQDRFANPRPGSYTASLSDELVRDKIMEEAQEVIEAKTKDEIIWEAADVFYFLTVLLAKSNVTIDDVLRELNRRRKK
ncbi:MAG: bifunctional phosphoribosyl-AMP cyclohydrolase/phosphoribosyl-ATP diphosphatase HisIE [Calditrichaeota bacterium]|nr:bifunctional phosphoribosyl-AMP cyclohydrolase/phosphoribosyl-ATP diphosphatase HisIE [Calditrichota bacterium]